MHVESISSYSAYVLVLREREREILSVRRLYMCTSTCNMNMTECMNKYFALRMLKQVGYTIFIYYNFITMYNKKAWWLFRLWFYGNTLYLFFQPLENILVINSKCWWNVLISFLQLLYPTMWKRNCYKELGHSLPNRLITDLGSGASKNVVWLSLGHDIP